MSDSTLFDFSSFEELFDSHWFELYQYAFKVLENKAEAEDIVQEIFCELWENRTSIIIESQIRAYLFGALRNKILKHFRSNGVRKKHADLLVQQLTSVTQPLHDIVTDNLLETLLKEIDKFTTREKEVFILNRIEGYSVKELADKFLVSEQTIRNQISAALHKIEPIVMRLLS
jgi:RNA polymerase sigma-70 factor (ECF subfamily)